MNLLDSIIYIIIPLLFIFFIGVVLLIIYSRIIYSKRLKTRQNVKDEIETFLAIDVFNSTNEGELKNGLHHFLSTIPFDKNWCKDIFLKKLIDFGENVKGEVANKLLDIYVFTNLHKYSLGFIQSSSWYKKSIGFYHFQAMGFSHGQRYVKPYLEHKNNKLRSNAYITFLYLNTEPLDFLIDYKYPILEASEHKVVNILYEKKPPMPNNIDDWLGAGNPSIVKLGIKIMVFYNYTGASEKIIKLLNSVFDTIRFEAYIAVKELYLFEAEVSLTDRLKSEKEKNNVLALLEALAVVGTDFSLVFLHDFIKKDAIDGDLKLAAVRCLHEINTDYLNHSFRRNEEIQRIKNHIKSPYILSV
ncbi:hypothetical protein SAMN04487906_0738 [Zhouia amylolytica]|uniref:HEAT repeat-containing protein n=1 Tax=Zhouia amylolytica TaxID=376730 RepID=A0A1I6QN09_9FLAO|nr:hypothetical protein [Zhouia amylolytica]SFS53722.1 hypothetical protein SAMN04487906_0738 [Zhouia amylolytica]